MTQNQRYIWQFPTWPKFEWDSAALLKLLGDCRFQQGSLLAQMRELGFEVQQQARAEVLIEEALKTSEIEGVNLDTRAVRSSVARRLGLPSAGLHTNGFSLARHVLFETMGLTLDSPMPGTQHSLKDELLSPHLSYLPAIQGLLESDALHALAHITGGGLTDNVPRVLPDGLEVTIDTKSWQVPPVFQQLEEHGRIATEEMFRVFNMGVGMVLVVDSEGESELLAHLSEHGFSAQGRQAWRLGTVRARGASSGPRVVYL